MASDDDEPFGSSTLAADLGRVVGGQVAGQGLDAEAMRRFRLKVTTWAEKNGFRSNDGELVARIADVDVVMRLFEMTDETAVVRASAKVPTTLSFTIEPARKSWTDGLRSILGKKPASIDPTFDEKFALRTSDEAVARQVLDEDARDAMQKLDAWARTTYTDGKIEVRIDTPGLAGRHLMRAIELAVALGNARVQTSAYR